MKLRKNKHETNQSNIIISIIFIALISWLCMAIAPAKLMELQDVIRMGTFTKDTPTAFEDSLNGSFPLINTFVDINGLAHRIFLQREMNGVIRLDNGQKIECMSDVPEDGIIANAESIKGLSDWLDKREIHFLYCQVPWKIDDKNNLLPAGVTDYSNKIADTFLQNLEVRNINYLDLRECISNDNIDRYSLYLKTEHHWTSAGGFYAFTKICDELRLRFGEDIPQYVTNIDNYETETFKNGSLGYYGQRTGFVFAGFDDFTLIYPKWETRQSLHAPHKEFFREGTFYDAIFRIEYLDIPWRERGLYGLYIGGDWPVVIHHSETAPNDKTVMILIDSFGTVVESYLTTAYKNVIALDLRWVLRNNVGKTTVQFIEEYNPDIVIVSFNPNQIGYAESEQFQYGISEE